MRISDWSSDVCSSDLPDLLHDLGVDAGGRAQQIDRFDDVGAKAELLVLHVSEALFEQIRPHADPRTVRSEEHTSELQSLMRISYAVFCLKKKKAKPKYHTRQTSHKQNLSKQQR